MHWVIRDSSGFEACTSICLSIHREREGAAEFFIALMQVSGVFLLVSRLFEG